MFPQVFNKFQPILAGIDFRLDRLENAYINDQVNLIESLYFFMVTNLLSLRRQPTIDANLREYGEDGHTLNWITEAKAFQAETRRAQYVKEMGDRVAFLHKQTKPVYGTLSPGCQVCGQGDWSCLFINGKCNCRCFYCPTVQNDFSVPTTNRIAFKRPGDYAAYVDRFNFGGVSISGGEPLLTVDRSLKYLNAVRRTVGDHIHLWLYTNGTRLTADHVSALKDAGLNEIRFDISAADYDLSKIALAAGHIPHITVEIPAIPEDQARLLSLIPMMGDMGVNYLNLHQLRLTPFNHVHLKKRPYTFLHGEKVTVLESELTALSILQTAAEKKWAFNINYCSFVYKHRYQRAAARRRNAAFMVKGHESITENGFIRILSLAGDARILQEACEMMNGKGVDKTRFTLSGKKDRLYFHGTLWPYLGNVRADLLVSYAEAQLTPAVSYYHPFKEISLPTGFKIVIERVLRLQDSKVSVEERERLDIDPNTEMPVHSLNNDMDFYEYIHPGLQDYF